MEIILASASPRRKQILGELVERFRVFPATGEERADESLSPDKKALFLAQAKAEEVFSLFPDCIVIGADTVVASGDLTLGKPKDEEDAFRTLKMLSGREHSVYTGICFLTKHEKISETVRSEVTFNDLSDEFISKYVAGGSPMDKAGSYGIQDEGVVKSYTGSYTNIVGLPIERTGEILRRLGVKTKIGEKK